MVSTALRRSVRWTRPASNCFHSAGSMISGMWLSPPWPLDPDRILITPVENSRTGQIAIDGSKAAAGLLAATRGPCGEEWLPVARTCPSTSIISHYRVENAGQRPVTGNELLQVGAPRLSDCVEVEGHISSVVADRAWSDIRGKFPAAERRLRRQYGRGPGNARGDELPPRMS